MTGGRTGRAAGRLTLACAAALLLAAPGPARADEARTLWTPHGMAWLFLPPAAGPGPHPVVLVLADRPGADGRETPYLDYLLQAGIAVLKLMVDEPDAAMTLLTPPWLRRIARDIAPGRLDGTRIGLLGFGGGGRAALAAPPGLPAAALYPACAGLAPRHHTGPTLLLHPDDPAETAACRHVTPGAEPLRGATHGWDHGHGPWEDGTALLPHPDGSATRLFSRSDGRATQAAVARVVRHFAAAFGSTASVPGQPHAGDHAGRFPSGAEMDAIRSDVPPSDAGLPDEAAPAAYREDH
ncbi:hypothetical protein JYK14_00815 [Siccirubricoccus sp. KC 17139]|uniref:Dienelactone hydrolase domain-containing protein n=1 Tax=Siccirubricoccus soli TaxID=2899147 RepID=A0ABT1CZ87_9PROT|nr:hypothetical protein [Siccirubricoccus soli]MCO6414722.1 hypothetical protein [Siccirubricoccus soli]MCP2680852.1 hypothetical protein [Siccirubricoccus soli]